MFDLDHAISDWRQQALSAGIKAPDVLNELESHLRDEIDAFCSSGLSEAQAFETAIARLGTADTMREEFKKVRREQWLPATIALYVWIGTVVLLTAIEFANVAISGRKSYLLFAHIVTLTAGYFAVFAAGSLGICYVCQRLFQNFSNPHRPAFVHTFILFMRISTILIIVCYLFGMLWSKQNRGAFFTGDDREIGPLFALTWLVLMLFIQRFSHMTAHMTMLLAIAGNIVVGLAWFGTLMIAARSFGLQDHLFFAMFIGVHIAFLLIGNLLQRSSSAEC
ncbi:MAG TPA: permease prefix domain 1-containing protein [Tepidisphaeraceae bacterium]|jgi:hypothetical protein|nr:permease prefix domain 1-containing protein [Tepidisphaeraceae bacterium]